MSKNSSAKSYQDNKKRKKDYKKDFVKDIKLFLAV